MVKSNDKKRARLEAIKHVLAKIGYAGKDEEVIGKPDRALIGPPELSEHMRACLPTRASPAPVAIWQPPASSGPRS